MLTEHEPKFEASQIVNTSESAKESTTTTYKPHLFTTLIPPCREDEYEALKEDIKAQGQQEPIVLHQGAILDGLTRYRACIELGRTPNFIEYKGSSPEDYVISKNLHRRHLTSSQLAGIAARFIDTYSKEAAERMLRGKGPNESGAQAGKTPGQIRPWPLNAPAMYWR